MTAQLQPVVVKDVIIVSDDYDFGMALVVTLHSAHVRIAVEQLPLERLIEASQPAPDAAIIEMRGEESVVDLRALFTRWPHVRCLFVAREMPLSAALARIIHQHGGTILSKAESPVVIAATLVVMLSGRDGGSA